MKKLLALPIIACLLLSCGGGSGSKAVKELSPDETPTVMVENHPAVDLGLSVMWASCNIGAATPYEFGEHYVCGGSQPAYGGDSSSYDFMDTALLFWGQPWRMPTTEELKELLALKHGMTTVNGVNGMLFTGANGNSIFLPCAGTVSIAGKQDMGRLGGYWTSDTFMQGFIKKGNYLCFSDILKDGTISDAVNVSGLSVRPVCPVQQ